MLGVREERRFFVQHVLADRLVELGERDVHLDGTGLAVTVRASDRLEIPFKTVRDRGEHLDAAHLEVQTEAEHRRFGDQDSGCVRVGCGERFNDCRPCRCWCFAGQDNGVGNQLV